MNGRNETEVERADRNWLELIQELRVAQTGIQVLAGFLLTLPFTSRFGEISDLHRAMYLVAFSLAVVTIGLMTAPVSLHRVLFARHEKETLVRVGGVLRQDRPDLVGADPRRRRGADLRRGRQRHRGLRRRGTRLHSSTRSAGWSCPSSCCVAPSRSEPPRGRARGPSGMLVGGAVEGREGGRVVRHTDWLLTKSERANAQTRLDDRHPGETAWSEGNLVRPLIHGSTYFAELHDRIEAAQPGDLVFFTDWQGDADEQLPGEARVRGRRGARPGRRARGRRTRADLALALREAQLQLRARTASSAVSSRSAGQRHCSTCACARAARTTRSSW